MLFLILILGNPKQAELSCIANIADHNILYTMWTVTHSNSS